MRNWPGKLSVIRSPGEPLAPVVAVVPVAQRGEWHDAGVQPWVAHVLYARDPLAALAALDPDRVYPGAVRGVAFELLHTLYRALGQLGLAADHLEVAALALEDGQRQPPVTLLGDHPIVHVAKPVELAFETERRYPGDLPGHVRDHGTEFAHRDEPFVHEPEDQLRAAPPADGVPVRVLLEAVEDTLLPQAVVDEVVDLEDALAA